jgi:Flp pilus assembly protein TadB
MGYMNRKLTWEYWKFGILKMCLLSFGILLGTYFVDFWKGILWLVWVVFIITYILAIFYFFRDRNKPSA